MGKVKKIAYIMSGIVAVALMGVVGFGARGVHAMCEIEVMVDPQVNESEQ